MVDAIRHAALWKELHGSTTIESKIRVATELLSSSRGEQRASVWLYEWLVSGVGILSKKTTLPLAGVALLCNVLVALPAAYLLVPTTPPLLAPFRHSIDALTSSTELLDAEFRETLIVQVRLLRLLISRSICSFRPSVEQVLPLITMAVGPIMQRVRIVGDTGTDVSCLLLILFSEFVEMLSRSLQYSSPKKAFRTVVDMLPSIAIIFAKAPAEAIASCADMAKDSTESAEVEACVSMAWPILMQRLRKLLLLLADPCHHDGYETLARNLGTSGSVASDQEPPRKRGKKGEGKVAAENAGPGNSYQSSIFLCAQDMLSSEDKRVGCVSLLPILFEDFVSGYRMRAMAIELEHAKDEGATQGKRSAAPREVSVVPCEFGFFLQLCEKLTLVLKQSEQSTPCFGEESAPVVKCLVHLWRLVRERGVFRPREDPKKMQSKALDNFCQYMLQRLSDGHKRSTARDAAEWDGLVEALALDVACVESRLDQLWVVIADLCPKADGTEHNSGGDVFPCVRLATALLSTYARLADLPSCLTSFISALRDGPKRRASCMLRNADFLKGLEDAALEVSTSSSPSQALSIWETLLGELQVNTNLQEPFSEHSWWAAKSLEHIVHGIRVQELSLEPFRSLLLRSFKVVQTYSEACDKAAVSVERRIDGLLFSLCALGRRVAAWDIPIVLRNPDASRDDAAVLRDDVSKGLRSLARSLVSACQASTLERETLKPYIHASVQWLALSEQERRKGLVAMEVVGDDDEDELSVQDVVESLLKLAQWQEQEDDSGPMLEARLEARRVVCCWVKLLTDQAVETGAKQDAANGNIVQLAEILVPDDLACWKYLGRAWDQERTTDAENESGRIWGPAASLWTGDCEILMEQGPLRIPILQRLANLTIDVSTVRTDKGDSEAVKRCAASLGLVGALFRVLALAVQGLPADVMMVVLRSVVAASMLACRICVGVNDGEIPKAAGKALIVTLRCLSRLLEPVALDGPGLHTSVSQEAIHLLVGPSGGDSVIASVATILAKGKGRQAFLSGARQALSSLVRALLHQRVSTWTVPMRQSWVEQLTNSLLQCRGITIASQSNGTSIVSLPHPSQLLCTSGKYVLSSLSGSLQMLLALLSTGSSSRDSSSTSLESMLCVRIDSPKAAVCVPEELPDEALCLCTGDVLSIMAQCLRWGILGSSKGHELLLVSNSKSSAGASRRQELIHMCTNLVSWVDVDRLGISDGSLHLLAGMQLLIKSICSAWPDGEDLELWEPWVKLVIRWTEMTSHPNLGLVQTSSDARCLDSLCSGVGRDRREYVLDALSCCIAAHAVKIVEHSEVHQLPPVLALLDGLASVLKNMPHKPQMRSRVAGRIIAATHGLLALGSSGSQSGLFDGTPDSLSMFYTTVADVTKGLFVHLGASTQHSSNNASSKETKSHRKLADAEALLLRVAGLLAQTALQLRREVAPTPLSKEKFSSLVSSSYGLMSALFMAVPQEGVRLPAWTRKPHIVVDVLKSMLDAVYVSESGSQAARIANDVTRLWEAYTHGGTRLVATSAGRTGLSTFQAKVQRATKGFVIMLIAHALDRQRRWAGVEAAVRKSLRQLPPEAREKARPAELAHWKEVVTVLEQGMVPLLTCLEGADHLKQSLYSGLREPLNTMFKEVNESYQKHGRYQGKA